MKKYRVMTSERVTQNFPRCFLLITARKHIYMTMLVVLPLNNQVFSGNF